MRKNVLIVDDNPNVRNTLEMLFKDFIRCQDVNLFFAKSGKEAWRLINNSFPNLIITDLNMESESAGIELAKRVKEKFPEKPIILMTSDPGAVHFGNRKYLDAIIRKPFYVSEFVEKVNRYLNISIIK